MQPEQRDVSYLWDMLDAARKVGDFTRNVTLAEYSANPMLHFAVGDVEHALIWDLVRRQIPVLIEQLQLLVPPPPPEDQDS